jgi:hypothetical protein
MKLTLSLSAYVSGPISLALQMLVETAMLAAVSGLAFLLSTILRLDNSLGYLLPLPIVLAALRGNVAAGWRTMVASALLLVVLLGPFRAVNYVLMHGVLAASLATLWRMQANFWLVILIGGLVRMSGSMLYLLFSRSVPLDCAHWPASEQAGQLCGHCAY